MKYLIVIFITILFSSCSSTKKVKENCKIAPFEELDSTQRVNQKLNYKFEIPKNWQKAKNYGEDWYFLEDVYKAKVDTLKMNTSVYIGLNKIRTVCLNQNFTTKDYLNYFLNYRSNWFRDKGFTYKILHANHKLYGEVSIVNYKEKTINNITLIKSIFLFFHKDKGYSLEYVASEANYQKHLTDIEKMVNSFEILE